MDKDGGQMRGDGVYVVMDRNEYVLPLVTNRNRDKQMDGRDHQMCSQQNAGTKRDTEYGPKWFKLQISIPIEGGEMSNRQFPSLYSLVFQVIVFHCIFMLFLEFSSFANGFISAQRVRQGTV